MDDELVGKQVKVSWRITRQDGSETQMHVAGKCLALSNTSLTLQGNSGELFNIPIEDLIVAKKRTPDPLTRQTREG